MAIIKDGTAKVQKGDTLSAIAKAAGTTVSAIAKANNIKNVNVIKPGQVFTIPGAKNTGQASTTPSATNTGMQFYPGTFTPMKYVPTDSTTEVPPIVEEEGLTQADIDAAVAAALAQMGTANTQQFAALQAQIAALLSSQKNSQELAQQQAALAAAQKAKQEEQQRVSIVATLTERFQRYGLGSLINKIKDLAIDGATESTITLALQESDEYKTRFKANQSRLAKGLTVLQPAEYLNIEDGYRQVLRSYGLRQFDTDEYVQQFIANDMSPTEFSNRVVTAVQRVQNADPAVVQQLRDFYGVGQQDLVAYVLDPEQQFQKIERQVAASEIGVAARRQGLSAGVSVAEQLAAQGVTQAEAQRGYATIADILPTAEKLSDIYGTTLDTYGQSEAEQEVFNSLASAQRKRQKLTAREVASFSGRSGASRTSLTTSSVGQF
jgi:murein DD-endopeptidase MepM/ murein hydrolase activator NlpD